MNYKKYLNLSREEIVNLLGLPDKESQRLNTLNNIPNIYTYGDIEYHFNAWIDGVCWMVFNTNKNKILASCKLMSKKLT
jgi:hypothetical protein